MQNKWAKLTRQLESFRKPNLWICLVGLTMGMLASVQGAVTLTTLHSFVRGQGGYTIYDEGLIQGRDGLLYGLTFQGGTYENGTIFKMGLNGAFTNLVNFNITNGATPRCSLVQGLDGNFYGTTLVAGSYTNADGWNGNGTVFKMNSTGELVTLASFKGTNGSLPTCTLIQGIDGDFYGTTASGGAFTNKYFLGTGFGTVFKITTNGLITTLASFNGTNGVDPASGLVQGLDGNFYGTTAYGGPYTNLTGSIGKGWAGYGTVFKMTMAGTLTTLATFNITNGANPYAGLVSAPDGCLYGATYYGGTTNVEYKGGGYTNIGYGTLFKINTNGLLTTLIKFDGTNGANPAARLTLATDGSFYGTTQTGGIGYNPLSSYSGNGTIFKTSADGAMVKLYAFSGGSDSAAPGTQLVQGNDNNFYGTAGANYGTIFRFSVPLPPAFQTVTQTAGAIGWTWSAVAGQSYQVQYSSDPQQTLWQNLGSAITATNGTAASSDSIELDLQRYYRIIGLP